MRDSSERGLRSFSLLILAALGLYLFFSLSYLHLPGLEYDETLFVNAALGDVDGTWIAWKITLLGQTVPLMLMDYIGALKAWLYAPIFSFIGRSAVTLRLPVVFIGFVTLCMTLALSRRMFGRVIALVSLVLLAVDPTFIFATRQDWGPIALSMVLRVSSLYFFWVWLETGRLRFAVLCCFLLGLGIYDKAIFLWYVIGFLAASLVCYRGRMRALANLRSMAAVVFAFIIGCLPLLAFNLIHGLRTLQGHAFIMHHWREYTAQRYMMFRSTLDGSMIYYLENLTHLRDAPGVPPRPAYGLSDTVLGSLAGLLPIQGTFLAWAFAFSMLILLVLWLTRRLRFHREILFVLIQTMVIMGLICILEEASGPHHTIMIYPFPHILIAVALWELIYACRNRGRQLRNAMRVSGCVCVMTITLSQVAVNADYLWAFRVGGGAGAWSAAIYDLAQYVDQHPDRTYLLMDWGFNNQLLLLCKADSIKKEETYTQLVGLPEEEKVARLRRYLVGKNALLVFHVPPFETYPLYESFVEAKERMGLKGRIVRTFYQGDGKPIYILYE